MQKWVTHEYIPNLSDSLYKPRADVSYIAENMGYKAIDFKLEPNLDLTTEERDAKLEGIIAGVSKGDIVVFQYPANTAWWFEWEFIAKLKAKGAKVALLLMDLKLLWGWNCPFPEIEFLNVADLLIVHSEPMKNYLIEHGSTSKIIVRELHDIILHENDAPLSDSLQKKLAFVGAANKSPFLKAWNYQTELWASYSKADFEVSSRVISGGEYLFEELVRAFPKDYFGILWDTDLPSEGKFTKKFQEYTRYNAPHKVGLYLALGLPLIVWEESAAALLIKKYSLGYTISSLEEIDSLMERLSDEELYELKQRVNQFSQAIRSGFFTRRALIEAEKTLLLND